MALPTRKEIRQSAEQAQLELARLKSPAGMAAFLMSQGEDYRRDVSIEVGKLMEDQEGAEGRVVEEGDPDELPKDDELKALDDLAVVVEKDEGAADAAEPAAAESNPES